MHPIENVLNRKLFTIDQNFVWEKFCLVWFKPVLIFQSAALEICISNKKLVNYQMKVKIYLRRIC